VTGFASPPKGSGSSRSGTGVPPKGSSGGGSITFPGMATDSTAGLCLKGGSMLCPENLGFVVGNW